MQGVLEKIGWYITASAAIVVLVACIIIQAPLFWMAVALSATIVLFFIIGDIIRYFFVTNVFPPEEVPEESEYGAEYEEEYAEAASEAETPDETAEAPGSELGTEEYTEFNGDDDVLLEEEDLQEAENAFME